MKTLPRRAPRISQSTQSNVYEDFIFVFLCAHFVVFFVVKSRLKIMNHSFLNDIDLYLNEGHKIPFNSSKNV
jgi:hypothetical protein